LRLFSRAELVFLEDWRLASAWSDRRARLRELQGLYRARLERLLESVRDLEKRGERPEILEPERAAAMEAVRALDRRHMERLDEFHRAFEESARPEESRSLSLQRREVLSILSGCAAVTLAGGNVAVLVNRLHLFGLGPALRKLPVFAWSAGAMAAAETILLFQDDTPQGPASPELFGRGLGLVPGVMPLPHASRRLHLDDALRVSRLARRFPDRKLVAMDPGSGLLFDGKRWRRAAGGARVLAEDGTVAEMDLP
jgi:peptidase E